MSTNGVERRCSRSTTSSSAIPLHARPRRHASRRQPQRFVHAVEGVCFSLARGRDARARRRVGLRQDHDRAGGAAAGRPGLRARSEFDGSDITGLQARALRPLRRRMQLIYQDPYESLDPRLARAAGRRGAARHPRPRRLEGRAARARAWTRSRRVGALRRRSSSSTATRTSSRAGSASASRSRRASSSGPSCSSPTSPSRCSTSRYAQASSPARPAARGRPRHPDDHARPLDRRALRRPDRRHVPRPDRRGGPGARRWSATRSTRTRKALLVGRPAPRPAGAHRRRRSCSGETPDAGPDPVRLPLPPALPDRRAECREIDPALEPAGAGAGHRAACIRV